MGEVVRDVRATLNCCVVVVDDASSVGEESPRSNNTLLSRSIVDGASNTLRLVEAIQQNAAMPTLGFSARTCSSLDDAHDVIALRANSCRIRDVEPPTVT